jgi:glycosyltransferase involved in cell wall biosynthesis
LGLGDKVVFTGYVDEADKTALYQGARIFAFPSLYEGFGFPPLEAMVSGVPVIVSDTSSMPEVVGDAGILISPKDKHKWVEAITIINTDDKIREKMKKGNLSQIVKFSWEKVARETIEVYKSAIEEYKIK